MDSCLFCTAPSTGVENGKEAPLQLKEEAFITDDADYHTLRDPFPEPEGGGGETGGESTKVNNHLNPSFILSRILKLPQHSVSQILEHHQKNIADFHSPEENQVSLNVCASCGVLVARFYHIREQVSELQRRLAGIEVELKSKISRSSNQVLVQPSSVNQLIRSLVLNETEFKLNLAYMEQNETCPQAMRKPLKTYQNKFQSFRGYNQTEDLGVPVGETTM
ncbi:Keratin, type I cytoskeletal 16, partial [Orchesella cincta]